MIPDQAARGTGGLLLPAPTAQSSTVAPLNRRALKTIGDISRRVIFMIGKFTPQTTTMASIAASTRRSMTGPFYMVIPQGRLPDPGKAEAD